MQHHLHSPNNHNNSNIQRIKTKAVAYVCNLNTQHQLLLLLISMFALNCDCVCVPQLCSCSLASHHTACRCGEWDIGGYLQTFKIPSSFYEVVTIFVSLCACISQQVCGSHDEHDDGACANALFPLLCRCSSRSSTQESLQETQQLREQNTVFWHAAVIMMCPLCVYCCCYCCC